jgi:hypothetical protein
VTEWQLLDPIGKTRVTGEETERGVLVYGADVRRAQDVQDVARDELLHHGAVEAPRLELKAMPHCRVDAYTGKMTDTGFSSQLHGSTDRHKKERKKASCLPTANAERLKSKAVQNCPVDTCVARLSRFGSISNSVLQASFGQVIVFSDAGEPRAYFVTRRWKTDERSKISCDG